MSKVTVTESYLEDIGDAIRNKLNTSQGYTPGQMAAAINSIPTGGITPTGTISITQNGTADVTQYASAAVNVPNSYAAGDEGKVVQNGALVAQTSETVTQNGTYDTTTKDEVVVDVQGGAPNLQDKTFTQNGTYTADAGYDGFNEVTVNVSGGGGSTSFVDPMHVDVSADSEYSGGVSGYGYLIAEKALGDLKKHWWGSGGKAQHWIKIQYEDPVIISKVKFSNYWTNGSSTWFSNNVTLQGSNDNSTWTDLLTLTGLTQTENQNTYDVNNNTGFLYYRFLCNNTAAGTFYTGLGKIRLYSGGGGANLYTNALANDVFIFKTAGERLCTANGRGYYKTTDGEAYGCYVPADGGIPLLVSSDPDAVKYRADSGGPFSYSATFEYDGTTYYVSNTEHAWPGDKDNTNGSLTTLTLPHTKSQRALEGQDLLELVLPILDKGVFAISDGGVYEPPSGYDGFGIVLITG